MADPKPDEAPAGGMVESGALKLLQDLRDANQQLLLAAMRAQHSADEA